ncbi:MAG TPA: HEPN domain-containing protein [Sedimentisphaerales bacterium]|nr:HEPN domain-containing protein [Sedimentisphaerales bacterium]
MNEHDARRTLIRLWLEKADDALASAELELKQAHTSFALNRLYYACFYAVTALLLQDEKQFARHSAVKSEFVKTYIKSGRIDVKWNVFYQKLFDDRQEGDYIPTVVFEAPEISIRLQQTHEFVKIIRGLIETA